MRQPMPRAWRARLIDIERFGWREPAGRLLDSRSAMAMAAALIALVWFLLDATT